MMNLKKIERGIMSDLPMKKKMYTIPKINRHLSHSAKHSKNYLLKSSQVDCLTYDAFHGNTWQGEKRQF